MKNALRYVYRMKIPLFTLRECAYALAICICLICICGGYLWFDNHESQKSLLTRCNEISEPYKRGTCLLPYWRELTIEKGAGPALAEAIAFQKQGVIDDCHLSAHQIGRTNFDQFKNDIGQAFASCPMGCIEGCFHGVMEGYVEKNGSPIQILEEVPKLCSSVSRDSLLQRQCVHGIGHGLLRHDPEAIAEVVALCTQLPSDFYRYTCLGGVFMENMSSYTSLDETALRAELPLVCEKVQNMDNGIYVPMCLRAIGEGLMFYTGHDLQKSIDLCSLLAPIDQNSCVSGATEEQGTHLRNAGA